ncbi:MAG: hypothetical protein AAFP90_20165, partial [Planctomycetota bacterium]
MAKRAKNYGNYCVVNGVRIELEQHPTDFSVLMKPETAQAELTQSPVDVSAVGPEISRCAATSKMKRDDVMSDVRQLHVAHHIYRDRETDQEYVIDDHIFLRAKSDAALQEIKEEYQLEDVGTMGETHILRVTAATGSNPIRTANRINERDDVEYCSPQLMVQQHRHDASLNHGVLFEEQWYLAADLGTHPDVDPRADIQCP